MMPSALRIILTAEEDRTLLELSYADQVPRRTKQRAIALRLNAHGWNVPQIAEYLDWAQQTVRQTIKRWDLQGLGGLWEALLSRKKTKLARTRLASSRKILGARPPLQCSAAGAKSYWKNEKSS